MLAAFLEPEKGTGFHWAAALFLFRVWLLASQRKFFCAFSNVRCVYILLDGIFALGLTAVRVRAVF